MIYKKANRWYIEGYEKRFVTKEAASVFLASTVEDNSPEEIQEEFPWKNELLD